MEIVGELIKTIENRIKADHSSQEYRDQAIRTLIRSLINLYEDTATTKNAIFFDSKSLGEVLIDFDKSKVIIDPSTLGKIFLVTSTPRVMNDTLVVAGCAVHIEHPTVLKKKSS